MAETTTPTPDPTEADASAHPAYLTVRDAAERLCVSEAFVRRLIRSGLLPVSRFGSAVRIAPATLAALEAQAATSGITGR